MQLRVSDDSCRARLKQRLEAAQEGVSTEDGSSSVTSGLDEEQAHQADMMMHRLVQVSKTRDSLLQFAFENCCMSQLTYGCQCIPSYSVHCIAVSILCHIMFHET